MTPEQQLQQLLTEAQELTSKMREALAKMGTPPEPAQWTPKKGDWAEVISVDKKDICKGIKVGDTVQVDEDGSNLPFCIRANGEMNVLYADQLRHLPDYQPQVNQ